MTDSLGKRIAAARSAKGLSQPQLAEKVLDSGRVSTLSAWENDRAAPDARALGKLASVLGVTTDYLLGRESGEPDEVDAFVEHALDVARRANGSEGTDSEEVRRTKADILAGYIKLGRMLGYPPAQVARLEEELAKLGGHAAVQVAPASTAERILTILERESQAALVRDEAIREMAVAARIDAQEGQARRERLDRSDADLDAEARAVRQVNEVLAAEEAERVRRRALGEATG